MRRVFVLMVVVVSLLFTNLVIAEWYDDGEHEDGYAEAQAIHELEWEKDILERSIEQREEDIVDSLWFFEWVEKFAVMGIFSELEAERQINIGVEERAVLNDEIEELRSRITQLDFRISPPPEQEFYVPMENPWAFTETVLDSNPQDLYKVYLPDGTLIHHLSEETFPCVILPSDQFILTIVFDAISPMFSYEQPSPMAPKGGDSVLVSGGQAKRITDPFGFDVGATKNSGFEIFFNRDGRMFYILSDPDRELPMSYYGAVDEPIQAGTHELKVTRDYDGRITTIFDGEYTFNGNGFAWAKAMTISNIGCRPEGDQKHWTGIHSVDLTINGSTAFHFDFNTVRVGERSMYGEGDYYSPIEEMPDVNLDDTCIEYINDDDSIPKGWPVGTAGVRG